MAMLKKYSIEKFINVYSHLISGNYMELVKIDEKMRIRIPARVRKRLGIKKKTVLGLTLEGDKIIITRPVGTGPENDPILKDMIERPLHSDVKITSEILERLEEEAWYP